MAERILIIEDEKELADILGEYLEVEGYEVCISPDGEDGLACVDTFQPDLILLDIMLPKVDGVTICREVRRKSSIPVIMLSAKSGEMDKVICLGVGADDYVTKPFSPVELVARVKAQLRRAAMQQPEEAHTEVPLLQGLVAGRLRMNRESYEAYIDQTLLELTTKEFEVLYFFAEHPGRVFSKEQIYESVWGMNEYGDISSVAVYIKRLREKLREFDLEYIRTIWGVGYKFFNDSGTVK